MPLNRRSFLTAAAAAALPASIARALDIPAGSVTGTIQDVQHVVVLMQENRSFDHYFGTLRGVRGFSDRFAAPAPATRDRSRTTIFVQPDERDPGQFIAPFRLDTTDDFHRMRTEGTPHTFPDAQAAWNNGRMDAWTRAKHNRSMGYFTREDIPFQFALAEAFTLCDAYHCAMHAGTNPNRVFHWTGTNDAEGRRGGPVIDNGYDELKADPKGHGGYDWTTYPERLSAAGVSWQIYQDMDDNFTDNPLAGFKAYRAADKAKDGPLADLARRAIHTRDLDKLREDALANTLPQVSWIVATAEGSEHPGPSSPAQGAEYTAKVLDALTANPEVWAKTVLLINFDENDGFFDHVPPPAPPSKQGGLVLDESQVDTTGEYHLAEDKWQGRPYGLGPRVPMYVVSPWSKGGYVNSQVFDHTSVIRFLEARFGVIEPNISAWRRAVCGDLTTCFDFASPDAATVAVPATADLALRARKLTGTVNPPAPSIAPPVQEAGQRPARPLPYRFAARVTRTTVETTPTLELTNLSRDIATVFHIYEDGPDGSDRRTVAAGGSTKVVVNTIDTSDYDIRVYGPNGFFLHARGKAGAWTTRYPGVDIGMSGAVLTLQNHAGPRSVTIRDEAYGQSPQTVDLKENEVRQIALDLSGNDNWYDVSVDGGDFHVRFAGHIEDGRRSMSDPAFGGQALLTLA